MSVQTPTSSELLQAEKHVIAGVYGRLLGRYRERFGNDAPALAQAVTDLLFGHTVQDKPAIELLSSRKDLVDAEILKLRDDDEIRRIVTDTFVLKAVFLHRERSCKDDSYVDPIERLKQLGIYLEGKKPPTPMSFVKTARDFFSTTPWQRAGIANT
jgi:hypothetical protein